MMHILNISMNENRKKILVLGIGNILMGDEGVGVHVIRELEKKPLSKNIDIVDGGTGGFHLLSYFQDYPKMIMIDATMDGKPEGSISIIEPKFAADFPTALTAHDIGLRDLIETAIVTNGLPEIKLITVSINKIQNMVMELSQPVKSTIPEIIKLIKNEVGISD